MGHGWVETKLLKADQFWGELGYPQVAETEHDLAVGIQATHRDSVHMDLGFFRYPQGPQYTQVGYLGFLY